VSSTSKDDATPEERWAAAAQLAAGVEDAGVKERRRQAFRFYRRLWLIGPALGVVVAAAEIIFGSRTHSTSDDEAWNPADTLPLIVAGAGLLVFIGAYIWAARTRRLVWPWRAISSPLNRSEKKSVGRQMMGKAPLDVDHGQVILAIALQNKSASLLLVPVFVGLLLMGGGLFALAGDEPWRFILLAELAVVLAIAPVFIHSDRRLGKFIESNRNMSAPEAIK